MLLLLKKKSQAAQTQSLVNIDSEIRRGASESEILSKDKALLADDVLIRREEYRGPANHRPDKRLFTLDPSLFGGKPTVLLDEDEEISGLIGADGKYAELLDGEGNPVVLLKKSGGEGTGGEKKVAAFLLNKAGERTPIAIAFTISNLRAGSAPPCGNYFFTLVMPSPDNALVWRRATAGDSRDRAILAVGYENMHTLWGNEGADIRHDTPACSRTVFLSGGIIQHSIGTSMVERVSTSSYNHIYVDFLRLCEDVPFMLDSGFFDCIVVGVDTFRYITRRSTLRAFVGMLAEGGVLVLPMIEKDAMLISVKAALANTGCSVTLHFREGKEKEGGGGGSSSSDRVCLCKDDTHRSVFERFKVMPNEFSPAEETDAVFASLRRLHPFVTRCLDELVKDYVQGYAVVTRKKVT